MLGRVAQAMFDAQDRLVSATLPGVEAVSMLYDARGRLTTITQGARVSTLAYDSRSRLATITDPLDRSVTYTYDDADRVTRQTLMPAGRFVDFTYDANGNVIAVTPPSRPQHGFGFTAVNLGESYTPPLVANGATFFEYNKERQVTRMTRPDSKMIELGYDTGGRVSTVTIGRGDFTFDYSGSSGNLQSSHTPEGNTTSYSYDGSLLIGAEWMGIVAGSLSWQYDDDFRVNSETVACATAVTPACQPVAYSYDHDDLLSSAGALNVQRRPADGLLSGSTIGNVTDAWTYNDFAEPLSYAALYDGAPILTRQYTRDDLGRIVQRVETVSGTTVTTAYTYDDSGRLHQVRTDGTLAATYTYDENGNRLTKTALAGNETATVDDQDRLLTYDEVAFAYTANGELLSKTDPHGTTTYDYDEMANLLKVSLPEGRTIEYVVDAHNRRMARKVDGVIVQRWIYAAGAILPAAELDADGNVVSRFIYAAHSGAPDVIIKGATTYRVIVDHLGSPRLVVDANTGAIAQSIEYDEFGAVTADTNPGFQPFGFAGGFYDPDAGLIRFGARDYDPHTGRWTAKDPIGFAGGDTNLYGYVMSDPVNFFDALGLEKLNFLPPGDPHQTAAKVQRDPKDAILINSHGTASTVNKMSAAQLAEKIKKEAKTWKPGKKIILNSCNAARGDNSIAQQLSKLLQTTVEGADQPVWSFGPLNLGTWGTWGAKGGTKRGGGIDFTTKGNRVTFVNGVRQEE